MKIMHDFLLLYHKTYMYIIQKRNDKIILRDSQRIMNF